MDENRVLYSKVDTSNSVIASAYLTKIQYGHADVWRTGPQSTLKKGFVMLLCSKMLSLSASVLRILPTCGICIYEICNTALWWQRKQLLLEQWRKKIANQNATCCTMARVQSCFMCWSSFMRKCSLERGWPEVVDVSFLSPIENEFTLMIASR